MMVQNSVKVYELRVADVVKLKAQSEANIKFNAVFTGKQFNNGERRKLLNNILFEGLKPETNDKNQMLKVNVTHYYDIDQVKTVEFKIQNTTQQNIKFVKGGVCFLYCDTSFCTNKPGLITLVDNEEDFYDETEKNNQDAEEYKIVKLARRSNKIFSKLNWIYNIVRYNYISNRIVNDLNDNTIRDKLIKNCFYYGIGIMLGVFIGIAAVKK